MHRHDRGRRRRRRPCRRPRARTPTSTGGRTAAGGDRGEARSSRRESARVSCSASGRCARAARRAETWDSKGGLSLAAVASAAIRCQAVVAVQRRRFRRGRVALRAGVGASARRAGPVAALRLRDARLQQFLVQQHELQRHRRRRQRLDRARARWRPCRARVAASSSARMCAASAGTSRDSHTNPASCSRHELGRAGLGAGDDRQAAGHRFERGVRERVVERRQHERVGRAEVRLDVRSAGRRT